MNTRSRSIPAGGYVVLMALLAVALPPTVASSARAQAPRAGQTENKGASIDETKLERRRALACVGNEVMELTGVSMRSDGVAISTAGRCEVRIKDSHILGQVAVQVAGGTVTVENTIIEGGSFAFQMTGGSISVKSSTIRGGVQRAGGSLKDLGNDLFK